MSRERRSNAELIAEARGDANRTPVANQPLDVPTSDPLYGIAPQRSLSRTPPPAADFLSSDVDYPASRFGRNPPPIAPGADRLVGMAMRARGSPSLSLEEAQSEDWIPGDGWLPRGLGGGPEPMQSPARLDPLSAVSDPAPFDLDADFRANTAMGRNADQSWRPEQWQGMEGERAPGYSVGGDDYALPHAAWETAIGRAPVPEFSPENAADIERRWNEREAIGAAMAARSARQLRDRTTPFGIITAPFVNTMVEPERRRAFVDWLDEPLLPEEWFTEEAWDRAGQSVQEAVAGAPDAIAGLPAATERVARETPSTMRRLGDALGEGYDWVSRQADPDVFEEPDFVGGVGSLALEYGPDILRGVTYGPWENEGELQAQLELARELERRGLGDAEAVNELARSANAEAGWAGVNAAFAPLDVPALAQFGREVIGMAPRASARLGAEASRTIPDSAPRSYEGAPSPQGEVIDVPFEVVEPRTQRRFEAAVQDPETGQVYAGLDHAEAIDAIPDEAVRARLDALYQSDPSFGGFNVDGRYMSREEGMASMREAAGRPSVRIGEQVNRDGSVSASDPIDWDAEIAPERASWRDLGLGAGALTAGGAALYAGDAEASDGVDADALTIGGLAAALGVPAAVAAAYLASRGRGARLPLGAATEPLERAVGRAGRAANDDMLARLEAAGTDFMDEPPMSGIDLSGRPIHENSEWVPHRLWEQSNPYGVSRGAWRDGDITGRANMNLDDEILENLNDLPMETREPFMREQPHFFNEGDIEGLRTDYDRALIEQAGTPAERARTRWGVDDPVLRGPALDISPDDILPRPAGFGRRLGEQDPIPLTMPNEDRYLFGRPEIRGTSRETASVPLDAGTNQLPEQRLNSAGNRRGVYDNNLRNGDRNAQIVDLREQFGRNAQADGGRGRRAEGSADHIAAVMRGEQPLPDGSFIETPRPEVTRSTVLGVWKRADDAARAAEPPEEAFRGLEEFGISPERARAISAQRNPGTDPLAIGALAIGTGALALGAGEAGAEELDGLTIDPDATPPSMRSAVGGPTVYGEYYIQEFADGSRHVFRMNREGERADPEYVGELTGTNFPSPRLGEGTGRVITEGVMETSLPPYEGEEEEDEGTPLWMRGLGAATAGLLGRSATTRLGGRGVLRDLNTALSAGLGDFAITGGDADLLESLGLGMMATGGARFGEAVAPELAAIGRSYTREAELLADPAFRAERDAFAETLSDQAPRVRALGGLESDPLDHFRYGRIEGLGARDIPGGEIMDEGWARDLDASALGLGENTGSAREQFLAAAPEEQARMMERARRSEWRDPNPRLPYASPERIERGRDVQNLVARSAPPAQPIGPQASFTQPGTGTSVFGEVKPPRSPRAPLPPLEDRAQLGGAQGAMRGVKAPTMRAMADDLGIERDGMTAGELRKSLTRALAARFDSTRELVAFLTRYGVSAAALGLAAASEQPDALVIP